MVTTAGWSATTDCEDWERGCGLLRAARVARIASPQGDRGYVDEAERRAARPALLRP